MLRRSEPRRDICIYVHKYTYRRMCVGVGVRMDNVFVTVSRTKYFTQLNAFINHHPIGY